MGRRLLWSVLSLIGLLCFGISPDSGFADPKASDILNLEMPEFGLNAGGTLPLAQKTQLCRLTSELEGQREISKFTGGDTWIGRGEVQCNFPSRADFEVQVCYFAWESRIYDDPEMTLGNLVVNIPYSDQQFGYNSFLGEYEIIDQLEDQPVSSGLVVDWQQVMTLLTAGDEVGRPSRFVFASNSSVLAAGNIAPGILVVTPHDTRCQDVFDFSLPTDKMDAETL
jgi:hypothetical protein